MGSPVNLIRSKENKNLLINGNFDFWQRGTTVSGASIYGADRWRGNSAMGSMQRRDRAFSAGLPLSAQYGCQFTSIVGGGGFGQRIEAARLVGMTGKYVTFSFRAGLVSGTTAISMNVGIPTVLDNYASRTFVEAAVLGTPGAHGSSYQTFSRTFQISADMEARGMEINVFGDATVWSIIFSQMMLLEAPNGQTLFIPSEFAYAGEDLARELALCQRYFEKSYDVATNPGSATNNGRITGAMGASGNNVGLTSVFKVAKRSVPFMTYYDLGGNVNRASFTNGGSGAVSENHNAIQVAHAGHSCAHWRGSTGVVGAGGFFRTHFTA